MERTIGIQDFGIISTKGERPKPMLWFHMYFRACLKIHL